MYCNTYCRYHRNVTYAIQSRMKRGLWELIARIWKGFEFELKGPKVDWGKSIGGEKMGASMGLKLQNELYIKIGNNFLL